MIATLKSIILFIMTSGLLSCTSFNPDELINLPASVAPNSLDSIQTKAVFSFSQYIPNHSELAMAFVIGDSVRYCGVRRIYDSLKYVENRASVFEIGSITKTFTAVMLARLVYEGSVKLDEPIKNILPIPLRQSALNDKEVTLLHLANHTSGFPKEPDNISANLAIPGSPYKNYDEEMLYNFLSGRLTLLFAPGERREYSNLGGGLLGHLLTIITSKSYETLLQETICQPLGLKNTFVTINPARRQQLVAGRDPSGRIVDNWELNVLTGGGGIKSNAEDMVKYLQASMTDTSFYRLTQQTTCQYTDHNSAGLGWAWYDNGTHKFVSATGGTGGYSCCVIFERSTRTAIVLLTNVSAFLAAKGDYVSNLGIALHGSVFRKNEDK